MYKYSFSVNRIFKHFTCKNRNFQKWTADFIQYSEEVSESILKRKPIVALESTVITHGLPYPENLNTAIEMENVVRKNKAVPATIGILDGIVHVGLTAKNLEILASKQKSFIKVSRRDMPYVITKGLSGGTTVAGTMLLAHRAGIPLFVTGGIGGVHRGAETTMDISADLYELSRTPMTVVSAGVKSILDIGLTLEYLETLGVCVATFGSSKMFPAFFTPYSKFSSACNVETYSEAAQLIDYRDRLDLKSGLLLAVPIPESFQEDGQRTEMVIEEALKDAK
ncbi:pseudouridine-5'-phosphate glycosidase-like [Stegodyphus dumicola]|uniref:pseudouridine-5'-phosphate glycosidase-like n=1 Tax=Stegodyphus dumicola TaxID=202533 RepID=UPI0015AEC087|nr:pseudouridine-5'-phosphate glycosidase-like [Stegodyphus dumicola]